MASIWLYMGVLNNNMSYFNDSAVLIYVMGDMSHMS